MEPVLVEPIGEPTITEPALGDEMLMGANALEEMFATTPTSAGGCGGDSFKLRHPTGWMRSSAASIDSVVVVANKLSSWPQ